EVAGPEGDLRLPFGDIVIDFDSPFATVTYAELFERTFGFAMTDRDRVVKEAQARRIATKDKHGASLDPILLVGALFDFAEELIDPAKPTFVLDYPSALCPLDRKS